MKRSTVVISLLDRAIESRTQAQSFARAKAGWGNKHISLHSTFPLATRHWSHWAQNGHWLGPLDNSRSGYWSCDGHD